MESGERHFLTAWAKVNVNTNQKGYRSMREREGMGWSLIESWPLFLSGR